MEVLEQTDVGPATPDQNEPEPADDNLVGNAIRFALNQHICQD